MPRRPMHRVQAALAARRFFIAQKTKSQIAAELGVSRFKVARLIDAAIAEGIIQFTIDEPDGLSTELGDALRQTFGLRMALVLDGPDLPAAALTSPLGNLAAQFLEETLTDGQVLGISWGRTLAAAAKALTHLPRIDVVQAAGIPAGLDMAQNPLELVRSLSSLSGGVAYPVYGPMWSEDPLLIERLRAEPSISTTVHQYDRIDLLVVGIGSWDPAASCLCQGFPPLWRDAALASGVQADLCMTLIDCNGDEVPNVLNERGLGIGSAQLRTIPDVIGVGGGAEKAEAIAAVLRGRWISGLITDAGVARKILG